MRVAAAIIAGGSASRMGGVFKPGMVVQGRKVLDRILDVLRLRFDEIYICSSRAAEFAPWDLPILPDADVGAGPMAGLLAVLEHVAADIVFVVAGDMPFVSVSAVDLVLSKIHASIDVVMPVTDRPQPLFAAYATRMAPFIRQRLEAGSQAMKDLGRASVLASAGFRMAVIEQNELADIDDKFEFLTNVNRPQDLP